MCEMRVVVLREMLGNRETGWSLWDGKSVLELTSKQIKDLIKTGNKVCGLMVETNGELVMDKEGFFTTNIMEHRHCGNFKPMAEDNCMANIFYICIGSHEEKGVVVYDCVTTRFGREPVSSSDMKAYLKMGIVSGGAKLDGEDIVLASLNFEKKETDVNNQIKEEKPADTEKKEENSEVKEKIKTEEKKPEVKVEAKEDTKPAVKTEAKEDVKPAVKTGKDSLKK